jgi:hypothetical protein
VQAVRCDNPKVVAASERRKTAGHLLRGLRKFHAVSCEQNFNMSEETEAHERVSVTWKWLAVTVVGCLIVMAGYDRASFDRRLEGVEAKIGTTPTKSDINELRSAIDKLSDKIDNVRDRVPARP